MLVEAIAKDNHKWIKFLSPKIVQILFWGKKKSARKSTVFWSLYQTDWYCGSDWDIILWSVSLCICQKFEAHYVSTLTQSSQCSCRSSGFMRWNKVQGECHQTLLFILDILHMASNIFTPKLECWSHLFSACTFLSYLSPAYVLLKSWMMVKLWLDII